MITKKLKKNRSFTYNLRSLGYLMILNLFINDLDRFRLMGIWILWMYKLVFSMEVT
jgi:hypothetical protein